MNENRELYVDLQLDDWIQPDDDFPVGVTTWKILQEDWWQESWIILNWKTTSWDYVRFIYANDGKLYYDPWTWVWIEIWAWWGITLDVNTKTFYPSSMSDEVVGQAIVSWYLQWKNPIIVYQNQSYIPFRSLMNWQLEFLSIATQYHKDLAHGESWLERYRIVVGWDNDSHFDWMTQVLDDMTSKFISTNDNYQFAFTPTQDYHPATKKYVDDWLALKQNILTAWTRITIDPVTNVISADVSGVMTYMWNVTDSSQLPSSWQNQWDCWYDETAKTLRAWDWNQWNDIGGTGIDLTNYFNMTTNTSDDITEWTTNLFVTQAEKNIWNSKQDQLTAWTNIQISNNVISATDTKYTQWDWIEITNQNVINNTAKFDPDNAGSLGQFLKKTNDGYAWADIPWWWSWTTYTAWDWIDITGNVISATDRFTPTNQWNIGQVLKKSGANTYYWANESWWGWNFNPENPWTTGQVLTKTATWYDWETIAGGEGNVKLFTLNSLSDITNAQAVLDWYNQWKLPIIKYYTTVSYRDADWVLHQVTWDYIYIIEPYYDSPSVDALHFITVETANNGSVDNVNWWTRRWIPYVEISYQDGTVSTITAGTQSMARLDFISPNVDYTNPYIPLYAWSPATKAYVDSRNWVWTLSEYNAIVDKDPNVFYNITSLS